MLNKFRIELDVMTMGYLTTGKAITPLFARLYSGIFLDNFC